MEEKKVEEKPNQEEKELTFKFSGKMARLLGRESVSSDVAALFELVKNSYDADASTVKIFFENFSEKSTEKPKIIIADDGDGMNSEEIEKNWMIIGTYSKDKNQKSKRGRRVVGNKGIGRFSTEKLAKEMLVISKPRSSPEEITLKINWDDYEKEDVTFNDVKNIAQINNQREDLQDHGTKIILTGLRETWTDEKIKKLRIAIASLVLPPEIVIATGDPFDVEINAPDFEFDVEKKVHSMLFKHAPFVLHATLPEKKSEFNVYLEKEGKQIHEEKISLEKQKLPSGGKWENFGKCKFVLYFYPGTSKYEDWDKYYRVSLKVSRISEYIEDLHGVKIYRDNFWVRPYGDTGNDWLDLDRERVMSNLKVGNSQVIGFVQLSKTDNPSIIDTTTRERLVENTSFESMKLFVKNCVNVLNKFRIKENKELRETQGRIEHQNALESEVHYLDEIVDSAPNYPDIDKKILKKSLRHITMLFSDFKGETEQDYGHLERKERTYRNLASLGISSATTSHEIHNIVAVMSEIPISILKKIRKDVVDKKGIEHDSTELSEYIMAIKQFLVFIRHFVVNVKDDFESIREKHEILLKPILEQLFASFNGILMGKTISYELRIYPEDLAVYINKADLYSVMVNMLTNSIKALDMLEQKTERLVRVTIEKQAYDLKILFSNNGPSIDEKDREEIFELFVSKYEEGTGLGLTIVREIIEEYGGKIIVRNQSEFEPGATFEITIPLDRLKK